MCSSSACSPGTSPHPALSSIIGLSTGSSASPTSSSSLLWAAYFFPSPSISGLTGALSQSLGDVTRILFPLLFQVPLVLSVPSSPSFPHAFSPLLRTQSACFAWTWFVVAAAAVVLRGPQPLTTFCRWDPVPASMAYPDLLGSLPSQRAGSLQLLAEILLSVANIPDASFLQGPTTLSFGLTHVLRKEWPRYVFLWGIGDKPGPEMLPVT